MPGLVGIITRQPREQAKAELLRMVESIRHESSYRSGVWMDESLGLYVGWANRAGSFAEKMPICNESGALVLMFSGEEYPEPGAARRLKERGHCVDPHGASYLVHMAEEDVAFPKSLNGRFHGILVNRSQGTALLFNDRFGMHRLYVHESPDCVYFATEAKAILGVRPELRQIDARGLGEFISCGCVLQNRSIFKGIQLLPGGSSWIFRNGILESKNKYFDPSEWESQEKLDQESYYQEIRQVFSQNLPRYFSGDEKLAISLTGGLDTRMIMAWFKAPPGSLPSYTFGGPFRECKDVIVGRKVAKMCGQTHQVIAVSNEYLSRFPHYAERTVYLSDGAAPVNRAADLYANEIAAQIAPARITGNYGSEILRRLRAFKCTDPHPGLFQPEVLASIEDAKQTYSEIFKGHAVSFSAFRQAPWYQYGLLSLEQTQLTMRSPFLDNDLVRTAFRAPESEVVKSDLFEENGECSRLIADGSPELHRLPTDRGLGGEGGFLADLSRVALEFSFKAEYAYDYGMPQWLAKADHAVSFLHLERMFLGRHKFCHYRVWFRDQLAGYVKEMLLDSRSLSRAHVDRKNLEAIVQHHVKGDRNYTTEIHRLLTLELQHRLFLDA
jgi:asparagine synthase (glutamine-hydrolysing)